MSEPAGVCPHCGADETYRKTHKDGRSTVVYACDTAISVSGKHYRSKACLQAEIERLTLERDAARREADRLRHGEPIEGDFVCPHELAADALRAENDRLREIIRVRTHREYGCICERCVESEYDVARVVDALRAELDTVRARLAAAKEVIDLSWNTLHYYGHNPGEQHVNASPSRRYVNEAMNKARAFLLAEKASEKAEAALKPADAGGESK